MQVESNYRAINNTINQLILQFQGQEGIVGRTESIKDHWLSERGVFVLFLWVTVCILAAEGRTRVDEDPAVVHFVGLNGLFHLYKEYRSVFFPVGCCVLDWVVFTPLKAHEVQCENRLGPRRWWAASAGYLAPLLDKSRSTAPTNVTRHSIHPFLG